MMNNRNIPGKKNNEDINEIIRRHVLQRRAHINGEAPNLINEENGTKESSVDVTKPKKLDVSTINKLATNLNHAKKENAKLNFSPTSQPQQTSEKNLTLEKNDEINVSGLAIFTSSLQITSPSTPNNFISPAISDSIPPPPPGPSPFSKTKKPAVTSFVKPTANNDAVMSTNSSSAVSASANISPLPDGYSKIMTSITTGVSLRKVKTQDNNDVAKIDDKQPNIMQSLKNATQLAKNNNPIQNNEDIHDRKWDTSITRAPFAENNEEKPFIPLNENWKSDSYRPNGSNFVIRKLSEEEKAKRLSRTSSEPEFKNIRLKTGNGLRSPSKLASSNSVSSLDNSSESAQSPIVKLRTTKVTTTLNPSEDIRLEVNASASSTNAFGVKLRQTGKLISEVEQQNIASNINTSQTDEPTKVSVPNTATTPSSITSSQDVLNEVVIGNTSEPEKTAEQVTNIDTKPETSEILGVIVSNKPNWFQRNWPWLLTLGVNVLLLGAGIALACFVPPVGALITHYAGFNLIGLIMGSTVASTITPTIALTVGIAISSAIVTSASWIIFGAAKVINKLASCIKRNNLDKPDTDSPDQPPAIGPGHPSNILKKQGVNSDNIAFLDDKDNDDKSNKSIASKADPATDVTSSKREDIIEETNTPKFK